MRIPGSPPPRAVRWVEDEPWPFPDWFTAQYAPVPRPQPEERDEPPPPDAPPARRPKTRGSGS